MKRYRLPRERRRRSLKMNEQHHESDLSEILRGLSTALQVPPCPPMPEMDEATMKTMRRRGQLVAIKWIIVDILSLSYRAGVLYLLWRIGG